MYTETGGRGANNDSFSSSAECHPFVDRVAGRVYDPVKRCVDTLVALTALVILFPFLVTVALLIKLDSRGPVIFVQKRWGKGGQVIRVYKFRSMFRDKCDPTGVAQTISGDERVTPVGKWLRSSNVDELPQLFNVLMGDMSLVGPRCHAIGMKAAGQLYEDLVPEYHHRHLVRPGITGLAQIRGWRGPTQSALSAKARILSDLYYVKNRTLFLDVQIIMATVRKEIVHGSGF